MNADQHPIFARLRSATVYPASCIMHPALPRPEIGLQKKADHRPHETSNGITMDGTLC
jgi:hypothetical protein